MSFGLAKRRAIELTESRHSAAFHDLDPRDGGWIATGSDPYLVYSLGDDPVIGAWMLDLHIEPMVGSLTPRIYVDQSGFNEAAAQQMRQISWNQYKLALILPRRTRFLRLDPAESKCSFRVSSFTATPISLGTFCARASRNGENRNGKRLENIAVLGGILADLWKRKVAFENARASLKPTRTFDYQSWIGEFEDSPATLEEKCRSLGSKPLISVLMPVYNTPQQILEEAIRSVTGQIYQNWELCIADDASSEAWVRPLLERWQKADGRIKAAFRESNGHVAEASNTALSLVRGEWVALLDHDDLLAPNALMEIALAIEAHPDAELIYSDEDKLDEQDRRYGPFFKPDWSYDLFTGQNYLNHLTVHRTANIRNAGGWRAGFEGSQDYDLTLRIIEKIDHSHILHIPKILYHWRAAKGSAARSETAKTYAYEAGRRALSEHAARTKLNTAVVPIANDGRDQYYRLKRGLPEVPPLVSLIIPTRDRADVLRICIESILTKTDYPRYEILIVDNSSAEEATLKYLSKLAGTANIRVIPYDQPFNFSAINNFAAKLARGDILGFINNDIEVINRDWLTEMVSHSVRPEIGCVGAKLYYPDGTLQHGGIILGVGGVAGHSHKNARLSSKGQYGRLMLVQNLSAVTAACLLVRSEVFFAAGGFDAGNLPIAFNDVDFCLRVRELGYVNLWTPFAELYHRESVSRGSDAAPGKVKRFQSEIRYMQQRWGSKLLNDPYYSENLTLEREDFSLALKRRAPAGN